MRKAQGAAVAISVVMVFAAYVAWYKATSSFNPNPDGSVIDTSSSCSSTVPPCPAFRIDSANLTVRKLADITSQELVLRITAEGPTQLDSVNVYFSNHPIGALRVQLAPGHTGTYGWAIPTDLNVTQGGTYAFYVEGESLNASNGQTVAVYWALVRATAR